MPRLIVFGCFIDFFFISIMFHVSIFFLAELSFFRHHVERGYLVLNGQPLHYLCNLIGMLFIEKSYQISFFIVGASI